MLKTYLILYNYITLKQKVLLNKFLLSNNQQGTSHILYIWNGILADNFFSGEHYFVEQLYEIGSRFEL